jgi:hypothetical protein
MDDFDIEMGDAVDVPMEEHEVADIIVGDDQQVRQTREETGVSWPKTHHIYSRRMARSRSPSTTSQRATIRQPSNQTKFIFGVSKR